MKDKQDDNPYLWKLYRADLADRRRPPKNLAQRDGYRKSRVYGAYGKRQIRTALDYHHASLILQHGTQVGDFRLAHQFAVRALRLGDNSARFLFAATMDRYLARNGKPQHYGTQIHFSGQSWTIWPTDPKTSDSERAKFAVRPLRILCQTAERLNSSIRSRCHSGLP